MDERSLRELELWPVVKLYGLHDATARVPNDASRDEPQPEAPLTLWTVANAPWIFLAPVPDPRAGKLLAAMMAAVGCAAGRQVELRADTPLDALGGRVLVAMGDAAAARVLGVAAGVAALRGRVHAHEALRVVVTYAPAHLLRVPADKAGAWEDLQLARRSLA